MTKAMAFVFARGGSKGLPGKNIRPMCGKPLLAYSIEAANACKEIERVFVSTDDTAIADVARGYGAEVIERPAELASDTSPEWLSWQHAIAWVNEHYGPFDTFVSVPATSPLTTSDDIQRAIGQRQAAEADICLSVTPSNHHPSFNMVSFDGQHNVRLMQPLDSAVTRRQDVPNAFNITTCVYVATSHFVMNNKGLFDGRVTAIEIPRERAVDIDDAFDFTLAELLMKERSAC